MDRDAKTAFIRLRQDQGVIFVCAQKDRALLYNEGACENCDCISDKPPQSRRPKVDVRDFVSGLPAMIATPTLRAVKSRSGFATIPVEKRFWSKVDKRGPDECWLWTAFANYGYGILRGVGGKKQIHANRVSWEINVGPIPEGMLVCHKCDTPLCVNPAHLFLGTAADNNKDRDTKRRQARGETNGRAKITAADVAAIRESPEITPIVAEQFGISRTNVYAIRKGRRWAHVAKP